MGFSMAFLLLSLGMAEPALSHLLGVHGSVLPLRRMPITGQSLMLAELFIAPLLISIPASMGCLMEFLLPESV